MQKILDIDTSIYDENILKEAIRDFEEVAKISFEKNQLKVEWENEDEIDEVINEFLNYYIWLVNQ